MLAGIPHAGLCGARARCSLCRVRVLGTQLLPPPGEAERRVLARLQADPAHIRLACQLRPPTDVAVLPLVPPEAQAAFLHRRQEGLTPHEQFIAVLVADMRGSTQLAAARLPYDNVFILGRFVAAISAAVLEAGGIPNQFLGDGVLAIFGLECDARTACRNAVTAVGLVARNIRQLNVALKQELPAPIDFGIGVHCGQVVVGEIGFRDHVAFTALGDAPNVASRLEGLTKELNCEAVISDSVLEHACLSADALTPYLASLRGRAEPGTGAGPARQHARGHGNFAKRRCATGLMFGLHLRWRGQPFAMAAPRDRALARFLTCGGRATVRQIVGIVRERFVALGGLALSEINGALNVPPPTSPGNSYCTSTPWPFGSVM